MGKRKGKTPSSTDFTNTNCKFLLLLLLLNNLKSKSRFSFISLLALIFCLVLVVGRNSGLQEEVRPLLYVLHGALFELAGLLMTHWTLIWLHMTCPEQSSTPGCADSRTRSQTWAGFWSWCIAGQPSRISKLSNLLLMECSSVCFYGVLLIKSCIICPFWESTTHYHARFCCIPYDEICRDF